jgi:hypothetical protein
MIAASLLGRVGMPADIAVVIGFVASLASWSTRLAGRVDVADQYIERILSNCRNRFLRGARGWHSRPSPNRSTDDEPTPTGASNLADG